MALTIALTYDTPIRAGLLAHIAGLMTFDASYPTGGYACGNITDRIATVYGVALLSDSGYDFRWNGVTKKLKVFTGGGSSAHTHTYTATSAAGSAHLHALTGENIVIAQAWPNLLGGALHTDSSVDLGVEPVNASVVAAYATVAAGAWAHGAINAAKPDYLRTLNIVIRNPTGGALNLYQGTMAFTITGWSRGGSITDSVSIISTAGNKSVGAGKYRAKSCVKPFVYITDCTLNNVPDNGLDIGVGLGADMGVDTDLATGSSADIYQARLNLVNVLATVTAEGTYDSVYLGNLADNDYAGVSYLTKAQRNMAVATEAAHTHVAAGTTASGGAAAGPGLEVANATDLSALVDVPFLAWGIL